MTWFDQGLLQRILLKLEASEESIYGPHAVYFSLPDVLLFHLNSFARSHCSHLVTVSPLFSVNPKYR